MYTGHGLFPVINGIVNWTGSWVRR